MSVESPFTTHITRSMYTFTIAHYKVLVLLTLASAVAFAVLLYKTYRNSQCEHHDEDQRWEHIKLLGMLFIDGCMLSLLTMVMLAALLFPKFGAVY